MTEAQTNAANLEQRILRAMRKTLASVVKDATPRPGTSGFLADETINQIKSCFELIAARERELAVALGLDEAKPGYVDQPQTSQPIQISRKKPDTSTH